jgi:hypothetical protein
VRPVARGPLALPLAQWEVAVNSPSPRTTSRSGGTPPIPEGPVVGRAWEVVCAAVRNPEVTLVVACAVAVMGAVAGWW